MHNVDFTAYSYVSAPIQWQACAMCTVDTCFRSNLLHRCKSSRWTIPWSPSNQLWSILDNRKHFSSELHHFFSFRSKQWNNTRRRWKYISAWGAHLLIWIWRNKHTRTYIFQSEMGSCSSSRGSNNTIMMMTMEQLLHPSTISLLHRTYLAFLLSSSSWVQSVSQPASTASRTRLLFTTSRRSYYYSCVAGSSISSILL